MFQKNYTLHFFLLNILLIGIISCQYTMTGSSSSEPSNNTETVQTTPVNNTANDSNEQSTTTPSTSESTTAEAASSPQDKNLFTNLPALSTAFQKFYNTQKYNIDQINAIHFIDVNEDFENDALFLFATTSPEGGNAFGLQMALFTKTKEGYTFVDQETYGGKFNTMGFARYNTQDKELTFKPIATFTGAFTPDGEAVIYKLSDKDISLTK